MKEEHKTTNPQHGTHPNMLVAVECILARYGYRRSELIAMLQDIQESYHYLPEEALNYVATALGISPSTVFGVATFYAQFSLDPKGKYLVRVCDGTACHVKGSRQVYDHLLKRLGLREGRLTTPDGLFTLETVNCLGACGIAPVMVINDTVHPHVTPEAAETIVETLMKRESEPQAEPEAVGETNG